MDRTAAHRHLIAGGIALGAVGAGQELHVGRPAETDLAAFRVPGAVVGDEAAEGITGDGAAVDDQLVGGGAAAIAVPGIDMFAHLAAMHLYFVAGGEAAKGIPAGQEFPDRTAVHDERVPVHVRPAAHARGQLVHGAGAARKFHTVVRGIPVPGLDMAAVGFRSQLAAGDGQGIAQGVAFTAETGTDEMIGVRAADAAAADGEAVARAVAVLRIPGRHLGVGALDVAVTDLQHVFVHVPGLAVSRVDTATGPGSADTPVLHSHGVAGCPAVLRETAIDVGGPGCSVPHLDPVAGHIALAVGMAAVERAGVQVPGPVGDDDVPPVRRVRTGSAIRGAGIVAAFRMSGAALLAAAVGGRNGGSQQHGPQQQPCQRVSQAAFAQDQAVAAQQHAQGTLVSFMVPPFLSRPRCAPGCHSL